MFYFYFKLPFKLNSVILNLTKFLNVFFTLGHILISKQKLPHKQFYAQISIIYRGYGTVFVKPKVQKHDTEDTEEGFRREAIFI